MKILLLILLLISLSVTAEENHQQFAQKILGEQQQRIADYAIEVEKFKSQATKQCSAKNKLQSFFLKLNAEKIAKENNENKQIRNSTNQSNSSSNDENTLHTRISINNTKTTKISTNHEKNKTIVFVSFSMPELSLRQWLIDAQKYGASVVIRGLKNNSFKDTVLELTRLLEKNNTGGLELNPMLFKDFHITKVPAVVAINEATHNFDVVYGNVSLEYALKVIANKQDKR